MFPERHGFVAVPATRSINFVSHHQLEMDKLYLCIFDTASHTACCMYSLIHSNETTTLRKHVSKYKNMRKWMEEFPRKFENRGTKIDRVN